jgi:putative membrane protein
MMRNQVRAVVGVMVATAGVLLVPFAGASRADERMTGTDRMFVRKVAQTNIAEIETSRLALKRSRNEKVHRVARMLIQGHTLSQRDLQATAREHGVTLPRDTDPANKALLRRLSRLSGAAFDKTYMTAQVRGHNATVNLFKEYLEKGNETHVRSFAAKYLPDIENHTQMIHNVAGNLGIPVTANGARSAAARSGAMKGM